MNAYQCARCGDMKAVPSIARDCELRHEGEQ